jgi:hypothetical protein
MLSSYPAPSVPGVVDGRLDLENNPVTVVKVRYPAINQRHTVSVLWESKGNTNHGVYCSDLQQMEADTPTAFTVDIPPQVAVKRSDGCEVTVRYSISIDHAEPVYSEVVRFEAFGGPGWMEGGRSGLAVRETISQWPNLDGDPFNIHLETDAIDNGATVYAKWEPTATYKVRLELRRKDEIDNFWKSDLQGNSDGLTVFKLPEEQVIKLGQEVGVLSLNSEKEGISALAKLELYVGFVPRQPLETAKA